MSTSYATDGKIGVNIDAPSAIQEHDLGETCLGNDNTHWIYVQANGAVATGTCTVSAAFQLTDAAGGYTADVAFADNEFGWVRDTTGATA